MGTGRHLAPFTVVPQTTFDLLNKLEAEHLAAQASDAKAPDSAPQAPRRLNSWCSHFENAIDASKSIQALNMLQTLTCPNKRLCKKMETKVKQLGFANPGHHAGIPAAAMQTLPA